jgi:hypothetical protein
VVTVGIARLDLPLGNWLRAHSIWIVVALAVTFATGVVQSIIAERGEKARRLSIERELRIQPFLTTSLIYLARYGGAKWETTGIQAFLVRRRGWRLQKQHVRLSKVRLAPLHSSGIRWTQGKGAIGRCWETQSPQFVDLEQHFAKWTNYNASQWSTLSNEQRIGLSHADYLQVKGKYGAVAAVPIVDRHGKYLGCVTADVPLGVPLSRDHAFETLTATAAFVSSAVTK